MIGRARNNPKRRGASERGYTKIFLIVGGFLQGFTSTGAAKNYEEGLLHDSAKDKSTLDGGAEEVVIL